MFRAFRFSTVAGAYWSVFDEGTDELSRRQTGVSKYMRFGRGHAESTGIAVETQRGQSLCHISSSGSWRQGRDLAEWKSCANWGSEPVSGSTDFLDELAVLGW